MRKKTFILLVFCMTAGLSCKKTDEPAHPSILGKWRLISGEWPMGRITYDFSQYYIVYEFKSDNVLTVTGDVDDQVRLGDFPYYFLTATDSDIRRWYTIRILATPYKHQVTEEELILDSRQAAGPLYYFVRIN